MFAQDARGKVATMRISPLVVLLAALTGCETDTTPGDASTKPPPGTCVVTPVPDVREFFKMTEMTGYGFRYSGAPLALSLDIYIQTISAADWNDLEKRKQIYRNAPEEEDQVVAWRSVSVDLIDFYESGRMDDKDARVVIPPAEGTIVFSIPDKWYSDDRGGYVKIRGQAPTSKGGTRSMAYSTQFKLTDKFRDLDADFTGSTGTYSSSAKKPITIAPGATTFLIAKSETASSGDGGAVYRLTYRLRAQCLRPPVVSHHAAEN